MSDVRRDWYRVGAGESGSVVPFHPRRSWRRMQDELVLGSDASASGAMPRSDERPHGLAAVVQPVGLEQAHLLRDPGPGLFPGRAGS